MTREQIRLILAYIEARFEVEEAHFKQIPDDFFRISGQMTPDQKIEAALDELFRTVGSSYEEEVNR